MHFILRASKECGFVAGGIMVVHEVPLHFTSARCWIGFEYGANITH